MSRTEPDERADAAEVTRRSRRRFLRAAAATGGVLTFGELGSIEHAFAQGTVLPPPDLSGIEHIVVLMMENRSFDHMLGWLEGADGRQRGLTYLDAAGIPHATYGLAPDFQGCGHPDPDHSYEAGRIEYNGGACDGWLRAGSNDEYAIGFTARRTCRSSPGRRHAGRSATTTSPPSWRGHSPIGSTSMRRRRIG